MPEGIVGIAILSLLTGAALNSMASGLVPDTNGGPNLILFQWYLGYSELTGPFPV